MIDETEFSALKLILAGGSLPVAMSDWLNCLVAEVESLRAENEALRSNAEALRAQLHTMSDNYAGCMKELEQLKVIVAQTPSLANVKLVSDAVKYAEAAEARANEAEALLKKCNSVIWEHRNAAYSNRPAGSVCPICEKENIFVEIDAVLRAPAPTAGTKGE